MCFDCRLEIKQPASWCSLNWTHGKYSKQFTLHRLSFACVDIFNGIHTFICILMFRWVPVTDPCHPMELTDPMDLAACLARAHNYRSAAETIGR